PPRQEANRSAWEEFRRGAFQPSLGGVAGTLMLTATWFLLCAAVITPRTLARLDHRYLMKNNTDQFGRVTGLVHRLRFAERPPVAVALAGASDLAMALSAPRAVERRLAEKLAGPTAVHDLMLPATSLWEASALTDALGERFRGAVVLCLGPTRL